MEAAFEEAGLFETGKTMTSMVGHDRLNSLLQVLMPWQVEMIIACLLEGIEPAALPWDSETQISTEVIQEALWELDESGRYAFGMRWLASKKGGA